MSADADTYVRQNVVWSKLPANVKQNFGNSETEYNRFINTISIKNQLRFRGNLIRHIRKDEKQYYEELINYSKKNLMLYPYHLADKIAKGLRIMPFDYYFSMLEFIMEKEENYDQLPNFTAVDCLRLLGVGRNEYIDLMNQYRSGKKFFRKKSAAKTLLPPKPISIKIEPWWYIDVVHVIEEDMKNVTEEEKQLIDKIIDCGHQKTGEFDMDLIHSIYKKGLIYLEVPIHDDDYVTVPPLEGFVMNRVTGDYFETLLYKIFVSIDENTSVNELASMLEVDLESVKEAVSLYCRLGFAKKKSKDMETINLHSSWLNADSDSRTTISSCEEPILLELSAALAESGLLGDEILTPSEESDPSFRSKRIGFIFDSTLTAFLMMGNLSPGLKSHAVTMFEVGKLTDESLDNFLCELEKVSTSRDDSEGEAKRYFEHALVLRSTILTLRNKPDFFNCGIDLIRCERLQSLEKTTCERLLKKNYSILISMAPLSKEINPIVSLDPPHLGPSGSNVNSFWFKLFIYHRAESGPLTALIPRGVRLNKIPEVFKHFEKVYVSSWGHEPGILPLNNILFTVNDALTYSPVLIQAYGSLKDIETRIVPFPTWPYEENDNKKHEPGDDFWYLKNFRKLHSNFEFSCTCGYIEIYKSKIKKIGLYKHSDDPKVVNALKHSLKLPQYNKEILGPAVDFSCPQVPYGSFAESHPDNPNNGITSSRCAKILTKELDELHRLNQNSQCKKSSSQNKLINVSNMSKSNNNHSIKSGDFSAIESSESSSDFENVEPLNSDDLEFHESFYEDCKNDSPECKVDLFCRYPTPGVLSNGEGTLPPRRQLRAILSKPVLSTDKKDCDTPSHEWNLLDCCFGVPLFDAEINKKMCDNLLKSKFMEQDKLMQLSKFNEKLIKELDKFIEFYKGEKSKHPTSKVDSVWLPIKPLLFDGRSVSIWNLE